MKMFSVFDSKAGYFMNPFPMRSNGEAIRAFETTCKDKNSQFNLYPADYTLHAIADFDSIKGTLSPYPPVLLANGSEFFKVLDSQN